MGIEPTKGTADASRELGIDVVEEFFSEKIANKIVNEIIKVKYPKLADC